MTGKQWAHNILVSISQVGNAICQGNPNATVSARVGYFAMQSGFAFWYWKGLEKMINFAFQPLDGGNHCYMAWKAESMEEFHQPRNDFILLLLGIIIYIACGPIRIITQLIAWFSK